MIYSHSDTMERNVKSSRSRSSPTSRKYTVVAAKGMARDEEESTVAISLSNAVKMP